MSQQGNPLSRRDLLKLAGASSVGVALGPSVGLAANRPTLKRTIPSSGEKLAIIGMGTSRTFDVALSAANTEKLAKVTRVFFERGGQLIDTSPMYGNAESMVGETLRRVQNKKALFTATKVWTDGRDAGIAQMKRSAERMGVGKIDLMQIHNLRDWKTHLSVLRRWKSEQKIRYIGITTSHGRFHSELKKILETEPFDFVQLSYNIVDRQAEREILPLAQEKGIATLINRPFQRGDLFRATKAKSLPTWAADIDCRSWAQFYLKFIAGHPAVTCIIPATSKTEHMADNMEAGYGRLPDAKMREKMASFMGTQMR